MRIAFLINRNIFYKYFSTIIDEALKRGYPVFCFHDYSQPRKGKKAYQFPALNQTPRFKHGLVSAVSFKTEEELVKFASQKKIDVIVSLHFTSSYQGLRKALQAKGIRWVALQNGLDSIGHAELFSQPDKYLFYTKPWLDFALQYLENEKKIFDKKETLNKIAFCGFSELDQVGLLNPYTIKKEWGIGEAKKVVVFLPFPFGATDDRFWSKIVYGLSNPLVRVLLVMFSFKKYIIRAALKNENDKAFCLALKKFCLHNNCYLLVKSRKKDIVKSYLAKIADKVLYDEGFYPATILKCFTIADLCVNFLSTAVLESIPLSVPNLSVLPPPNYKNINNPVWKLLLSKYRDIFDFKGVSKLVSLSEAFKFFKEKNLNDFTFDIIAQKEYVKKYIGSNEPSEKAVDEIEKIV